MIVYLGLVALCIISSRADKDDKRWIWSDNEGSSSQHRSLHIHNDPSSYAKSPRYEVTEEEYGQNYFPVNNKPPVYVETTPPFSNGLPIYERPGGIYGSNSQGNYGGSNNYYPEEVAESAGVLTGPVPSWVPEGSFKNYDKCKCTEKFNCPSPGISYGHCDTNKQYCCIATKDNLGGPDPSKPIHSIENGILAGPGGPVDNIPIQGVVSTQPRPPHPSLGAYRPGGYNQRPSGGFGIGPGGQLQGNVYSPENGVLVGPGPYRNGFGLGRSNARKA